MLRFHRFDGVSLGIIALTGGLGAALHGRLPARVATHFDLQGAPNGWMDRTTAVLFLPLFSLGIWGLIRVSYFLMPEGRRKGVDAGILPMVAALTVAFMAAIQAIILRMALVPGAALDRPLLVVMGGFWVALGLVMPRVRQNPFVGVRTAWTLSSPENWARTHRFAGYAMCMGGAFGLLMATWGTATVTAIGIAGMLASALVPAVYSVVLSFRLKKE